MSGADDLVHTSARALAARIASRDVSACDVLEAHLAQIARVNPQLNAIVTLATDQAREAAAEADATIARSEPVGALHGVPVLIKDVTLVKDMRTTFGSPLYQDFTPTQDSEPVARLRQAGAIILGKTNTPEFAAGANTVNELFGATRNPWDVDRSPAGSSGGSAAAVASGMAPLAQGTDYGCSIRIPASFCGIVGLRTTAGLIPNRPMRLPWDAGQVHGPLARDAEDAALMLDAMTGLDPLWPISCAPPWPSALAHVERCEDAKGLRIAYASDIAGFGVDVEVDAICAQAARGLVQQGAVVEHIAFDVSEGIAAYKTLRGLWMVGQQIDRLDQLESFGPNLRGNVEAGLTLTALDIAKAERAREQVWERFRDLLQRFDALITPAAPTPPYPLTQNFPDEIGGRKLDDYIDWVAPAFLITLVGFPAASAPAGKTASGLPVGVQIVGARFADPMLLGLAKLIQRANPIGWPPVS